MPELPEVETTRRGILPYLVDRRIRALEVREPRLRWPVEAGLPERLAGRRILAVDRRGKYLLIRLENGTLIVHLGMSGSLRVVPPESAPPRRHDHVELVLEDGTRVRYHDPRRFGAWLWSSGAPEMHPLLRELGPEPLAGPFDGAYLYRASRGRRTTVKSFIMDSRVVVGVGNIYANEALFAAGVHPLRQAGRIACARYERLADAVREVLLSAIRQGGTTLRDYVDGNGTPGYFSLRLQVYGHGGEPCPRCGAPIRVARSAQRSTFYCLCCQH